MLEEWYAFRQRKLSEEIFMINVDWKMKRLGKHEMINHVRRTWNDRRSRKRQLLHGHLFRIGAASLRWTLGASREEIQKCGRWQSDAYKIYLRKFSEKELKDTRMLLRDLRWRASTNLKLIGAEQDKPSTSK